MAALVRPRRGNSRVSARGARTLLALALQLAALAALVLALLGHAWLDARSKLRLLVLVDRSDSMPRAAADKAVAEVVQASRAAGAGELQWLEFAGRPAVPSSSLTPVTPSPPSPPSTGPTADLEPSATHVEAALQAALAAHAQTPFDSIVVVSDGHETSGDTARALRAVREARLPLQWIAVGRPPPETRIAQVLAPARARVGQRLQISVQLAGRLHRPLRIQATARSPSGATQATSSPADGDGRVLIEFDASAPGVLLLDLRLEDPASGQILAAMTDAAAIDVAPRAAMLYAQGSAGPLARSLLDGGWALNVLPAARLDAHADGLDSYQAVVLDDVAIADASPRFWRALVAAVKERGLGLMVLGGERSFARGGYRGSALESVLPVLSEPAALDQPASIVFAVDKSGSMGQGSGGVDRFQLAQRAVLETARGLTERDSLGLVVFDVAPRVLIPLGPALAGTRALERDWQASPNGGTRLVPALEAAATELERSAAARRMLVVVTDGFIDDAPLAALRARLDRARIEIIALAVGPDADVSALARLVGADAGLVLRVNQAAELPLIMRTGLEQRRARIERGTVAVQQRQPLPFSPGMLKDWPPVTAHFVTRALPQAVVAVQTQRGDPLIALQSAGRGRVVALTSGLGRWTPSWLPWPAWPQLAGGLADWVSGTPPGGAAALLVSELPAGLQVELDIATDIATDTPATTLANTPANMRQPDPDRVSIVVDTPTTQGQLLTTERVAPGRLRATLPEAGAGLYTFLLSTPLGTQRQLHLRRQRAESETSGTNPALEVWRAAGLIRPWAPDSIAKQRADGRLNRPLDRTLIALALALFLAGVLVDRARLDERAIKQALRRWRKRAG